MTKVVSFGLGPIGLGIAEALLDRKDVQITGAIDANETLIGRDLGECLSRGSLGILIGSDSASALDSKDGGVVVHATSSQLRDVIPQLETIVGSGWNVLSTCEELTAPAVVEVAIARAIDRMASQAGVTVVGAGVNPGFLMDVLPLLLSGLCLRVDSIWIRRVVDTNQRRPQLQTKVGVGMTAAEFALRARQNRIGHVGLRQSAHLIADTLGWRNTQYNETLTPVIAVEETPTAIGSVHANAVLGTRQLAILRSAGQDRVRLQLEMYAGAASEDRIEINGVPPILQIIPAGVNGDMATAALISNLVGAVDRARPGLLNLPELLPLACAFRGQANA